MKINCPKNLCNNYYIVFFHSLPLLVILESPVSIMRPFILFSKVFQIKRVQDEELMLVVTFTCLLNHMIFLYAQKCNWKTILQLLGIFYYNFLYNQNSNEQEWYNCNAVSVGCTFYLELCYLRKTKRVINSIPNSFMRLETLQSYTIMKNIL